MKIIAERREDGDNAEVSSAHTSFPLSNLFDEHARNYWIAEADVEEATLRIPIAANCDCLLLGGTNAETAVVAVHLDSNEQSFDNDSATNEGGGLVGFPITAHGYSSGDVIVVYGTTNYDAVYTVNATTTANSVVVAATYVAETFDSSCIVAEVIDTVTHDLTVSDDNSNQIETGYLEKSFGLEYTYQIAAHTATIFLEAASGSTIHGGVFVAGPALDLDNPIEGIRDSRVDNHIRKDLNSGGKYTRRRNRWRVLSGTMRMPREADFYRLMNIIDQLSPSPAGMLITDINDTEWAIFGFLKATGHHSFPTVTDVGFEIEEAP